RAQTCRSQVRRPAYACSTYATLLRTCSAERLLGRGGFPRERDEAPALRPRRRALAAYPSTPSTLRLWARPPLSNRGTGCRGRAAPWAAPNARGAPPAVDPPALARAA